MEMNPETIKALLDAFHRSDWRQMTVTVGNDRLHVSRDAPVDGGPPASPAAAAPAAPPTPAASAPPEPEATAPEPPAAAAPASDAAPAATAAPPKGTVVESPSVGLFWRAPAPGAPPFVEVGHRVAAGDTLGIVEVMKLMNHLVSPVDGVVAAILAENGGAVEFGQALVVVDPEG